MSKRALWVQSAVFLVFLGAFFLLNLILPDKSFSEQENRSLQTIPPFSLSSLFSGKFTSDYESYVTDQFAFRDDWIRLKARSELISGKKENNGIYLCENETLIEAFEMPDEDNFAFQLNAVADLAEKSDKGVYFALIPSAAEIWSGKLPEGAPNASQATLIERAYAAVPAKTVDMLSALSSHSDEDIFYRTDHHWTTLGAYYGYRALMDVMGLEAVEQDHYTAQTVSESFYGTTYSSSGFRWVRPDSIQRYVEPGGVHITNYPNGSPVEGKLYEETALSKKDKYSYFYGGNTPLLEIETGNEGPSLLIVRDSYMDSLSPFLFPHFSRISIVDLRYYKTSLKAYIDSENIDEILICYSVPNFVTDTNIFLVSH